MSKGRPRRSVVLSEEDRLQLSAVVRSRSLRHGLVMRARVVLLAADGLSNDAIAEQCGLSQQSVCLWRKRYVKAVSKGSMTR